MILLIDEMPRLRLGADGLVIIEIAPSRQAFTNDSGGLAEPQLGADELQDDSARLRAARFGAAAFALSRTPSEGWWWLLSKVRTVLDENPDI